MYETFAHTADLGLRVQADSLEQLFREAALGLLSMQVVNIESVLPQREVQIEITGDQIDYQLFDWLTELLYRFDSEHMLFCQFEIQIQPDAVQATCRGEPMDPQRHQMDHEVKAITYHGLKVEQTDQGWLAEVIVDI